ncbi:hypothetical protein [Planomicrobium sp. Y74]|uniref:hypothetical protein n=1 Tax=Planomicrobium sp. Y74 TaxID=2478977 RepID=UPI000EF53063|nr:hypothetical protein [Planomicrobium sp. Y74]RLQ92111.1 hypothetical protein D9754_04825 [Planomicrobium sp. Y74]
MTVKKSKKKLKNKEGGKIKNSRDSMSEKAIIELYVLDLITESQESAALTLYRSCLQAYQRTRDKSKPWYNKVEFHFENPLDMAIQFITTLPNEWKKWQLQQLIFEDKTVQGDRPSVDRIDSKIHYSIDNIQTDSIKGNYTDASNRRRKKIALLEFENGQIGLRIYDSQTELRNDLNIQAYKIKDLKKQPYEIGVKNNNGDVLLSGKQVIAMEYMVLPPRSKEKQNRIDKQSYTELKERIELLERFSFDVKRANHIEKLKETFELYRKFGWDKL